MYSFVLCVVMNCPEVFLLLFVITVCDFDVISSLIAYFTAHWDLLHLMTLNLYAESELFTSRTTNLAYSRMGVGSVGLQGDFSAL